MASPRFGQLARNTMSPAAAKSLRRAAPRHALERDPDAERDRQDRELAQVADDRVGVRGRRASTSTPRPAAGARRAAPQTSSIDFATSTLYACSWPSSPSKSRSASRPVTRRPLSRTARTPASMPAGCPTTSAAEIITCEKPACAHRGELALERARERRGVHPEVAEDHRARRGARGLVVHELEHHAAERAAW